MAKKETTTKTQASLQTMLNRLLKEGFECNTNYPLHVFYRMNVNDCTSISLDEIWSLTVAMIAKAAKKTQRICSLKKDCPNPKLISATADKVVCNGKILEVDATFIFMCVP